MREVERLYRRERHRVAAEAALASLGASSPSPTHRRRPGMDSQQSDGGNANTPRGWEWSVPPELSGGAPPTSPTRHRAAGGAATTAAAAAATYSSPGVQHASGGAGGAYAGYVPASTSPRAHHDATATASRHHRDDDPNMESAVPPPSPDYMQPKAKGATRAHAVRQVRVACFQCHTVCGHCQWSPCACGAHALCCALCGLQPAGGACVGICTQYCRTRRVQYVHV